MSVSLTDLDLDFTFDEVIIALLSNPVLQYRKPIDRRQRIRNTGHRWAAADRRKHYEPGIELVVIRLDA